MERVGKVVLKYTKEELAKLIQDTIANAEKVSIESMNYEDGKFVVHAIEGINKIPQAFQVSRINFDNLLSNKKSNRQTGLKGAMLEILAGDVRCSLEQIIKDLELKGFKGKSSKFRTYLVSHKDLFVEVDPNIFQLKAK